MKALKKLAVVSVFSCAMVFAFSAQAQTSKPGLWEVSSKTSGTPGADKAMADIQKQMASMPPEQRKQIEVMMGKQGINFSGPGGAMVMKTCITREMLAQSQLPLQTQGNCTSTTSEKTSNSMKFKYVCTNPTSNGEGQFVFQNDSSYTSKMTITDTAQGKPQTTTMEGAGKWLGSDCGTVKPLAPPKAIAAKP